MDGGEWVSEAVSHYKKGYLLVRLKKGNPQRFFNLCMVNQIELWKLTHVNDQYQFYITVEGYRNVWPLVKKAQVQLHILGKFGLPFFIHRNRKRWMYGFGVITFFLIIFYMSCFIWNISIQGNYRISDDTLLHYLERVNIIYGTQKNKIDCDDLEEEIRTNFPNIIWVSARISGTKLLINIKENEVLSSIPTKTDGERDLVANQDGVITSLVVRRGKAQVSIGDVVKKGQILVSGTIPIRNDSEELVSVHYVWADADIRGNTSYSYEQNIPSLTSVRVPTGVTRHGISIRLFMHSFVWMFSGKSDYDWEYVTENRQLVFLKDFYFPIWIQSITAREYCKYERFLTTEEVDEIKNTINDEKIQDLQEKGVQIIEKNVKLLNKSSAWSIHGDFVVNGPIGTGQNIIKTEEIDQTDERN